MHSLHTLHNLHRPLGSTDLLVSPLGLGTVKLGRDQGVKYQNGFTIPDDAGARRGPWPVGSHRASTVTFLPLALWCASSVHECIERLALRSAGQLRSSRGPFAG